MLTTDGNSLVIQIDTEVDCSIMVQNLYEKEFNHILLVKNMVSLIAYSGGYSFEGIGIP